MKPLKHLIEDGYLTEELYSALEGNMVDPTFPLWDGFSVIADIAWHGLRDALVEQMIETQRWGDSGYQHLP